MAEQMSFFDRPSGQKRTYAARKVNKREGRRDIPQDHFGGNTRFSFTAAFGYPVEVTARWTTALYRRSAAAAAAVDMVVSRCWQTDPAIRRGEGEMEPQERFLNETLDRLGFWRAMREADRRSLAGNYSGLILRIRDGMPLDQPVGRLRGGANAIAEVIPVWQVDLKEWHIGDREDDPDNFGKVIMYQYTERDLKGRKIGVRQIHPDRVLLLSQDGTMWANLFLEPAFNACIDLEKARGGGGEGLFKDARALTHFDITAEAELESGVGGITNKPPGKATGPIAEEVADSVDEQMENIDSQYNNMVMTKGIKSSMLQTKMRGISDTAWVAMNNVAAAVGIPVNILFGNQTGERAASQDEREWGHTCESRRWSVLRPRIIDFIERLVRWGVLDGTGGDWRVDWADLAESDVDARQKQAQMTLDAFRAGRESGLVTVTIDEIRKALGLPALTEEQIAEQVARVGEVPQIDPPGTVDSGGASE